MKKNGILLIILSCLTISLYAQEEKTYWDNGNVKSITNHDKDGNKTGYWEEFYENGEQKEYGYYEDGRKVGTWNEYYIDGTRKKSTSYNNGLIYNIETYFENGRTMVIGNYDEDEKKDGRWVQYFDNYQPKLDGDYAQDKKHGSWKYFTDNGALHKIENYDKGSIMSKWEGTEDQSYEYAVETVSVAPMAITEGVEESAEIVEIKPVPAVEDIDQNGVEYIEEIEEKVITYIPPPPPPAPTYEAIDEAKDAVAYSNEVAIVDAADAVMDAGNYYYGNRLNGVWEYYNEAGNVIETGSNKNSQKEGKWISYYDNGQIKKEQFWDYGKLSEVISYYDNEGISLDKGTFKNGNGTVNEYDKDNKLISNTEYVNGEILDWNDSNALNSLAWDIYENQSDKATLQKAIKMVKRSIELEQDYYNTDTYAALLFKTGNNKQALIEAKEAIKIAKKDGDDFSTTTELIAQINKKMK